MPCYKVEPLSVFFYEKKYESKVNMAAHFARQWQI